MITPTTLLSAKELFVQAKELINSDVKASLSTFENALVLANQETEFTLACEIHTFLAKTYRIQGKAYKSIEHLNKAYRLLNQHFPQDKINLSLIYKEYGGLYANCFKDYATALDYSLKSLSLENPDLYGSLYNNIGCQYVNLAEYEKANIYLKKGKKLLLKQKDNLLLSFIHENFGEMYRVQGAYQKAIEAYNIGLDFVEVAYSKRKDHRSLDFISSYILIGLANCYLSLKEYESIPPLISEVYKKVENSNLHSCASSVALIEGEILLVQKNIPAFKNKFESSIKFCTENSLFDDKEVWLQRMINLCETEGDYKEALAYSKMLMANTADQDTKTTAVNLAKVLENKEFQILDLENRNKEMQLQKEQLEQFAYIVAHDLKTPLSNISNFIGLFARNYRSEVDEENGYYLDFVLNNSKKLHKMLDELLKYITVEKFTGNVSESNVELILEGICKKYQQEIDNKGGLIEFNLLPKIKVHGPHLEIIFNRMIKNALKFSRKDRNTHIKIEVEENSADYVFRIIDNGIGIKEEYHQKIFSLFKQLDKVNYSGTGMGLAICKKIINTYGGKIEVVGNDWGGTTFEFNIPKK